jgi:trigger factor
MTIQHEDPDKFSITITPEDDGFSYVEFIVHPVMVERIKEEYYKAEKKFLQQKGFRKGRIPRKLMEKKMGGEEGAYSASFTTYANAKLFEHSPTKVLYTTDYEVKKNGAGWMVTFKAWLEPKVEISDDILEMAFEIPKLDVGEYVDHKLRGFSKLHPYLHIKDGPSEDGDMVQVKIQATLDGKEFLDGSHDATNIRLMKNAVHPPSLYEKLLGVVPDDSFTIETSNPEEVPRFKVDFKNKKSMKMEVTVIRVFTCEESKIDDDLAITAGFDSLDEWKVHLHKIGEELTKNREEVRKKELLLEHLSDKVPVPDMPEGWTNDKAEQCVRANLVPHNSPAVRETLNETAKHITILKAVGQKLGVEWEDEDQDTYNRDENAYSDRVLKHLLSQAFFTYVEPTPEDSIIRKIDG